MVDTVLSLGGYDFTGFGVPEKINGGGAHKLVVHKMLGGQRVIDALGADDDAIKFRGRFRGATAMDDAMLMDALRRSGTAVTLTYWNQTATVVVEKFTFDFERFYEVPYELVCTVVSNAAAQNNAPDPTADSAVGADLGQGAGLAAGNPACAAAFDSLPATYAANGPLAGAPASAVAAISSAQQSVAAALAPIAQASDVATGSVDSFVNQINDVVVASVGGAIAAARLTYSVDTMTAGATAQLMIPFVGRIGLNISAAGGVVTGGP